MRTQLGLPAILVALLACVMPARAHRDLDPDSNLVMLPGVTITSDGDLPGYPAANAILNAAAFRESELIDLPVLMDRDGAAARRWKVGMLPVSFVIDRQGAIRYRLVGEANWTGPNVAPLIERLIGAGAKSQSASAAR